MSENQNRRIDDLSKYDTMATEQLEEILRLDAEAPEEQESDTDKILYIMEVLAERKRNDGHTGKTALEAYESFKQNYMPETDTIIPLKPKQRIPRWVRSLTATAAVLAVLLAGSFTAKALGFNIWKAVVCWSQETFRFGDGENSNASNDLPYASLQDALGKESITALLVPTWFPNGYKLVDVNVDHNPSKNIYKAVYSNGELFLIITVQEYLNSDPIFVEQSDGLIEEYEVSGIMYYLFENNKRTQAVWIVDSFECHILGDLTIDELKLMINSIEKG